MKQYLAIALCLGLGACGTTTTTTVVPDQPATATTPDVPAHTVTVTTKTDPLTALINKLQNIGIPDLQAASLDAAAHNDPVAKQCYDGLVPIVQGLNSGVPILPPTPIGLATAFQDARDIKGAIGGGGLSSQLKALRIKINLACGALQMDVAGGVADPLGLFTGQ